MAKKKKKQQQPSKKQKNGSKSKKSVNPTRQKQQQEQIPHKNHVNLEKPTPVSNHNGDDDDDESKILIPQKRRLVTTDAVVIDELRIQKDKTVVLDHCTEEYSDEEEGVRGEWHLDVQKDEIGIDNANVVTEERNGENGVMSDDKVLGGDDAIHDNEEVGHIDVNVESTDGKILEVRTEEEEEEVEEVGDDHGVVSIIQDDGIEARGNTDGDHEESNDQCGEEDGVHFYDDEEDVDEDANNNGDKGSISNGDARTNRYHTTCNYGENIRQNDEDGDTSVYGEVGNIDGDIPISQENDEERAVHHNGDNGKHDGVHADADNDDDIPNDESSSSSSSSSSGCSTKDDPSVIEDSNVEDVDNGNDMDRPPGEHNQEDENDGVNESISNQKDDIEEERQWQNLVQWIRTEMDKFTYQSDPEYVVDHVKEYAPLISSDILLGLLLCEWWPRRMEHWTQEATFALEEERANEAKILVQQWKSTLEPWLVHTLEMIREDKEEGQFLLRQHQHDVEEYGHLCSELETFLKKWSNAREQLNQSMQAGHRVEMERALAESKQYKTLEPLRTRALSLIQQQIILKASLRDAIRSSTPERETIERIMLDVIQSGHGDALQDFLDEAEQVLQMLCQSSLVTPEEQEIEKTIPNDNDYNNNNSNTLTEEPGAVASTSAEENEEGYQDHLTDVPSNLHPLVEQFRQHTEPLMLQGKVSSKRRKITRENEHFPQVVDTIVTILSHGLRRVFGLFGIRSVMSVLQDSPLVDLQRATTIFQSKKLAEKMGSVADRSESVIFVEFLMDQDVLYKYIATLLDQQRGYLQSVFQNSSILLDTGESGRYFRNQLQRLHQQLEFRLDFPVLLHEKRFTLLLEASREMIHAIESRSKSYAPDLVFNTFLHEFSTHMYKYLSMDLRRHYVNHVTENRFYMLYDVIEFAAELYLLRQQRKTHIDNTSSVVNIATAVQVIKRHTKEIIFSNRPAAQYCKFQLFAAYCLNNRLLGDVVRFLFTEKTLTLKFFRQHLVVTREHNWRKLITILDTLSNVNPDDKCPFDISVDELLSEASNANLVRHAPSPCDEDIWASFTPVSSTSNSPSFSSFMAPRS